jgi:glycosyltransferase involved in cell wall biosynthesis
MPRLLVLSTGVPHPSIGANVVAQHIYLTAFRDAGYEILQVMLLKKGVDDLRDAKRHQEEFSSPSFRILPVPVAGFLASGRSILQSFRPVSLPKDCTDAICDFAPEICFCMDIAAAGVRSRLPLSVKTVVWLGDLNFDVAWYKALYAMRENLFSVLSLPFAWWEAQKWRAFYRSALSKTKVIASVFSSVASLRKIGIHATYLPYAWPTPPLPERIPPKPVKPTFVFFGHLSGLGSRSAFHFLTKKLYPQLVSLWGRDGFSIVICGIHAIPPWVQKSLAGISEVRILGFVENLAEVLLSSHGVIVPIDVPIGNRTRIITSLALGVPVIAHANTALGNPSLRDGETCYLAKSPAAFVERMQRAFQGGTEVERIIGNAKKVYAQEYDPLVANRPILRELEHLQE